jgi:predicted PurR-regulated permease PerM
LPPAPVLSRDMRLTLRCLSSLFPALPRTPQLVGCTFILSFIGNSVINVGATRWPSRRRLLTFVWFSIIIMALAGFGLITIPSITREGAELVHRIQSENPYVLLGDKMRSLLGNDLMAKLERFLSLLTVSSSPPAGASQADLLASLAAVEETVAASSTAGAWGAERAHRMGTVLQGALKHHTTTAVNLISAGLAATTRFTLQGLVSLILSFVIVWDMPAIRRGVESLRHSRLSWLYAETAPSLSAFGHLFGKALQAQCLVAAVNTALTAAGILFLQLPGVAFLSLIVFFCSFIPVAGVIISTVPLGFVALTEYGVGRLLAVLVLVAVAHAVEAYLLNPAIYSAHLKLHPLIVLVVLVLGEHVLGVWGLLLAVPMTVFTLEFLVKTPEQRERDAQLDAQQHAAAHAKRLHAPAPGAAQ